MAIALSLATLISLMTGCALFGVYTVLFLTSIYVLLYKRKRSQPLNVPIVIVAFILYILALMHIVVCGVRAVTGFISYIGNDPSDYFVRSANNSYLLQVTTYAVQTLFGDGFLIYRLYMVWNRDLRFLIPACICWIGCLVATAGILEHEAHAASGTSIFVFKAWISSFFGITLFTNFSCTSLIALKIWLIERRTAGLYKTRSLSPVLVIIIESGAVYSAALLSLLITFVTNSWSQYIVLDAVVHIIGITFSLIIVRMGLGLSADETTWRSRTNVSDRTQHSESHQLSNFHKNVVAIQVSRECDVINDNKHLDRSFGTGSMLGFKADEAHTESTTVVE